GPGSPLAIGCAGLAAAHTPGAAACGPVGRGAVGDPAALGSARAAAGSGAPTRGDVGGGADDGAAAAVGSGVAMAVASRPCGAGGRQRRGAGGAADSVTTAAAGSGPAAKAGNSQGCCGL